MRRLLYLTVAATIAGCSSDLPEPHEVEDLRVLAIRADPPELLFDTPEDRLVTFQALVVDPRGGSLNYRWRFCPVESDATCSHWKVDRESVPAARRDRLDSMLEDSETGVIDSPPGDSPDDLSPIIGSPVTLSPYAIVPFAATMPAELVAHHVETTLLGYGMGVWPAALLELSRGDEHLSALKRIVLNVRDPGALASLFEEQLGATICTAPGQTDCLDLPARQPNQNPEILAISWAVGERADGNFLPVDSDVPLVVRAGESIRIRPELIDGAAQTYHILATGLTDASLFIEERQEQISISWFCAAGALQDNLTWPVRTRTLDTAYTAPEIDSKRFSDRDTVWMVARDQRGGVAWRYVEIQITE